MDRRGEDAVTPIIGTILVLAITVAGIGATLFFGAPVIKALQEQAALEAMVGQFQEVRHGVNSLSVPDASRAPGISLPSGTLVLGPGTHVMVTVSYADPLRPNCDFALWDWEDFGSGTADRMSYDALNNCRQPNNVLGVCAVLVGFACLKYQRDTNGSAPSAYTNFPTAAAGLATVGTAVTTDEDWHFVLASPGYTGPGTGTLYAEAWLLHSNRLAWTSGSVAAFYEMGAVLAQDKGASYIAGSMSLEEPTTDAVASEGFFLRIPTMQIGKGGALSGSGSHAVAIRHSESQTRISANDATTTSDDVRGVRIDFDGRQGQAWCTSLLVRNTLAPSDGTYGLAYTPIPAPPSPPRECVGRSGLLPIASTGTYGVKYTPSNTIATFTLSQPILDARLQV